MESLTEELGKMERGNVKVISKYARGEGYLEKNGAGGYYITHVKSTQRKNFLEPSAFIISFNLADVQSVDVVRRTITLNQT